MFLTTVLPIDTKNQPSELALRDLTVRTPPDHAEVESKLNLPLGRREPLLAVSRVRFVLSRAYTEARAVFPCS